MGIDEPLAADSIRSGVDIISFSGDKLLGGPQAGIIAGKKLFVEKIRRNPLFRALRVDKLTLAVLEYVLRAYLRGEIDAIPTWRMLQADVSDLKARADRFAGKVGPGARAIQLNSLVGGGSAPERYIPSWGVALDGARPDTELEQLLRNSDPPVIVRIEDGKVVLDFRTIFVEDEDVLLTVVKGLERPTVARAPDTSLR